MKEKAQGGFTLIEAAMAIVLASILAAAFVTLLAPQINLTFFVPQRARLQAAAQDLLGTVVEGDGRAPGIRYAAPASITTASASAFTYSASSNDGAAVTVAFSYDGSNRRLTRQIDGGAAEAVPLHAGAGSDIRVDPLENNHLASPALFRYFNSAGTEFTGTPAASIARIDVGVVVGSGTASVEDSEGRVALKTGIDIKRYTS